MGWRANDDIQRMLRDNARAWLADKGGAGRVRAVRAMDAGFDPMVWAEIAAMGWTGVLLPESVGGSALGLGPALTFSEEMGRAAAPEPFVASAIIAGTVLAAGSSDASRELAAKLARGSQNVTLAWQEARGVLGVPDFATTLSRNRLNGAKVHVPAWQQDAALLVAATGKDGPCVLVLEGGAPGMTVTVQRMTDGSLCADLEFRDTPLADDAILLSGDAAREAITLAIARGTVALSAQLEGLSNALWLMTADYLRERSQFGNKLSDFQALRHRMVDLFAEIELAAASWRAAAAAVEAGDISSPAIHAAKARCSQIAQDMGRWAIQYHGAFGYMEEADVGLFVHAGLAWSSWLGNPTAHRRAALLAHRREA